MLLFRPCTCVAAYRLSFECRSGRHSYCLCSDISDTAVDADECALQRTAGGRRQPKAPICSIHEHCVNTIGSYICQPTASCVGGFAVDPATRRCVGNSHPADADVGARLHADQMLNADHCATPCLKKTVQICFCQHFVKFPPILIIFYSKMTKRLKLCCEMHSFSTSPNLCHHTTVLNADVRNCYTTLKVVICSRLSNDLISKQSSKMWLI